jgi:hypothetical protein
MDMATFISHLSANFISHQSVMGFGLTRLQGEA